jgi:xylan 1,4-beta-xylosidase
MMEERHEIIDFGGNIPIRCFIHRLGYTARHWHNSIELLYVLVGEVKVTVNNETHNLIEEDLLLINSNDIHELTAEDCVLFAAQIESSLFDSRLVNINDLRFDCNSSVYRDKRQFLNIKRIIAQFVKANANEGKGDSTEVIGMALSYSLLYELLTNFKADDSPVNMDQTRKKLDRLARILNYINEHYREDISLAELAEQEHLSIPYLSKFLTKNLNMNFMSYLNKLRMETAIKELLSSDESVETVAYNSGFPNPRAFVQLFKKEYNMLPSQFRSQNKGEMIASTKQIPQKSGNDYIILEHHDYLSRLAKYLTQESEFSVFQSGSDVTTVIYKEINAAKSPTMLKHTFKAFTSVGKAKEILYSEVQDMLRIVQKEIGYEYIKFHGLLSDDMMVYTENKNGEGIISFALVDKVLDFLLSIELKPLIQLSFMPKALAKYPDKTVFNSGFITSEPKDMEKWNHLIREFTHHLLNRYGKHEVQQWKFTVWNEPDTPESMFAMSSQDVFYDFYKNTYDTVKSCHSEICFGSPSSYYLTLEENTWIMDFTNWCKENNCLPDFVNIHFYGTDFTSNSEQLKNTWDLVGGLKLSEDPDIFKKFVDIIRNYVDTAYGKDCDIYLTEWNSTPSHFDLMSDTCFKSCYIVKNVLESYDRLDSFGFWVLTDFFEENPIPTDLFHGGLGLLTYNGIKKPGYYAFYLLNKLGSELIDKGEGYFVTRERDEFRIMLYNYKHYSSLYAKGETFDMTFTERYTPFGSDDKKEFSLQFNGIDANKYEVTEYVVNRQNGSCFDKWVEMGARHLTLKEEIETLDALSRPMISKYTISPFENKLDFNAILDLLEIRFISIKPVTTFS